ncbi:MAG: D-alanine--D-alanine ligase [Pseudomonadota bacterium]
MNGILVGMTYDLRQAYLEMGFDEERAAEFDSPRTVEAIEDALNSLGFQTERIGHVRNLVSALAQGRGWDLVFNIAEGVWGYGRESQVPGLLEAYNLPYTFSDPLTLALTLHKGMAKRVVRDHGLATPDFALVENELDVDAVDLPYPLFAKPVAEGTGKGVTTASRIENREELGLVCRRLLEQFRQPVLVETFLPGREFTVGIVGTGAAARVIGVMEVILLATAEAGVYSFTNKEQFEERVTYLLPDDAEAGRAGDLALAAYRALGCRDAGRVDVRSDACGRPNFIEVNPLAGLHPEHSDLPILAGMSGMSFRDLISQVMDSALARARTRSPGELFLFPLETMPAAARVAVAGAAS